MTIRSPTRLKSSVALVPSRRRGDPGQPAEFARSVAARASTSAGSIRRLKRVASVGNHVFYR